MTFQESSNYGAILQAYGLQEYLNKEGYSSEVINYRNPERGIKNFTITRKIKHHIWHKVIKRILIGNTRKNRTDEFITKYIPLSKKVYNSKVLLKDANNYYDVFITGSDQVWNPKNTSQDYSYFLDFANADKFKMSYAPSFGLNYLPDYLLADYKNLINNIDKLSIRETEGQDIIKDLTGKNADVVLDPTMLLTKDEWSEIAVPPKFKNNYVLCYHLPGFKIVNDAINKIARDIAKVNGWKVVHIGEKEYMRLVLGEKRVFNAGPKEFLGLFENASYVVTNSFHGTVFSIMFNKNFYVPIDFSIPKEKVLSSRISSLLNKLNISDRLVSANDLSIKYKVDINYAEVNENLYKEREESTKFIKNALKDISNE